MIQRVVAPKVISETNVVAVEKLYLFYNLLIIFGTIDNIKNDPDISEYDVN
jgi:hypothetical protein